MRQTCTVRHAQLHTATLAWQNRRYNIGLRNRLTMMTYDDDDDEGTSRNAETSLYVAETAENVEYRLREFLMRAWSERSNWGWRRRRRICHTHRHKNSSFIFIERYVESVFRKSCTLLRRRKCNNVKNTHIFLSTESYAHNFRSTCLCQSEQLVNACVAWRAEAI